MWDKGQQYWKLLFQKVKSAGADYDELLLAAYSPRGVHVYRYDGRLGLSTNGKATAVHGKNIQVYGPRGEES